MSDSKIRLYFTSISSSMEIKKKQQKILDILVSKKFDFDKFDIASNPDAKAEMRKLAGNERALPPQLAVGEKFLGGYDEFENAVEMEQLAEFFQV